MVRALVDGGCGTAARPIVDQQRLQRIKRRHARWAYEPFSFRLPRFLRGTVESPGGGASCGTARAPAAAAAAAAAAELLAVLFGSTIAHLVRYV